jgi:hypothetical protein
MGGLKMSLAPIVGLLAAAAPVVGAYAAIKQATASAPSAPSAPSAEDIVKAQEKAAKESTLKPQMSQGEASITAAEIARETAAKRRRSGYMSTLLTTGGMQLGLGNQASVSKKTLLGA